MTTETVEAVDTVTTGNVTASVSSDGTIAYATGGGKCYAPAATKLPRCSFHKYSDPKNKLPSRCVHPTIGRALTAQEVNAMKDCAFYTPKDDLAAQIIANTVARPGIPTGTIADRGMKAMAYQSVPTTTRLTKAASSEMWKKALQNGDEIQIGREMVKVFPDDETHPKPQLVPSLDFTYIDNIDKVQGSLLEFIARAVVEGDIAVLIGHLGGGKTTGVMKVAEMCNAPLAVINCDGQLTVEQVIGTRVPILENGVPTLAWRDAPLLDAYRNGYWAVVDDYTFTGSDVFSAIFGLMTNKQYQVLVTGEIIPRHQNFRLFLTTNPAEFIELYPNRQQPDAAFLSRIQARYWVDFLPKEAERKAMQEAAPILSPDTLDRMQKVIEVSRNLLKQGSINFVFSTRHAVNWAKKVARSGKLQQAAFESFLADMDTESKNVMQNKVLDAVTD